MNTFGSVPSPLSHFYSSDALHETNFLNVGTKLQPFRLKGEANKLVHEETAHVDPAKQNWAKDLAFEGG